VELQKVYRIYFKNVISLKNTFLPITDNFDPIDYKSKAELPKQRSMPPYNGFGSEEDSLCNCLSLIPKPPKRDFIKFMEKDRLV